MVATQRGVDHREAAAGEREGSRDGGILCVYDGEKPGNPADVYGCVGVEGAYHGEKMSRTTRSSDCWICMYSLLARG